MMTLSSQLRWGKKSIEESWVLLFKNVCLFVSQSNQCVGLIVVIVTRKSDIAHPLTQFNSSIRFKKSNEMETVAQWVLISVVFTVVSRITNAVINGSLKMAKKVIRTFKRNSQQSTN